MPCTGENFLAAYGPRGAPSRGLRGIAGQQPFHPSPGSPPSGSAPASSPDKHHRQWESARDGGVRGRRRDLAPWRHTSLPVASPVAPGGSLASPKDSQPQDQIHPQDMRKSKGEALP